MGDNPLKYKTINNLIIILCLFIFVVNAGFFWIFKPNKQGEVGRYQFFVKDNNAFAYVYVFDTKTSRIFLRSIFSRDSEARHLFIFGFPENDNACLDLGTVNQPLIPHIDEPITEWREKDKTISPQKPIRLSDLPSETVQPQQSQSEVDTYEFSNEAK